MLTMTGNVLAGHETIRNCQTALTTFYRTHWPDPKPAPPRAEPAPALDLDDERIVDLARRSANGTKFIDLYDGGISGHPSPSEARYALMGILNFYTDDAEQMERILQTSGQWTAKCEARPELVRTEIAAQIADYTGPRYDPTWGKHATSARTNTVGVDLADCADVRAQMEAAQEHVASLQKMLRMERETRKEAEDRAARLHEDVSALVHTVLNPELKHNQIVTMVSTWGLVASKAPNDDGTVEVTAAEVSNDYRPRVKTGEHTPTFNPTTGTRPRMARSATKRVMTDLIEAGIVTAQAAPKRIERDGDLDYTATVWHVEKAPSLAAHLAPAVAFTPQAPTARKPRTTMACLHCGEVHSRTRRTYCNGCGAETEPAQIIPTEEPVDTDDQDTRDRVEKISTRETVTPRVSVPSNSMVDKTSTRNPSSRPGSSPLIAPTPTLEERMTAGGWN
jgi:hypothetical protein